MLKNTIAILVALSTIPAFADNLKVKKEKVSYIVQSVEAEKVKGIEITLSRVEKIDDCNERTLLLDSTLVGGNGDGYYDKYFLSAGVMMTEMYCPLKKAKKETIVSEPIVIKSITNPNLDGLVKVAFVVPKGFKLNVKELK